MAGDPDLGRGGRLPVILDVDTGIDDALALFYACASPEIDLLAVTCVAGNVPLEAVVANTLAVLEVAGRGDVPVHAGADRPLVKPLTTTEETHGPEGIGYATRPSGATVAARGPAATAIVDIARRRPGEVHLVTLGPMTNLALALDLEPRLPSLLRRWTFMGGAFRGPGNTTPTSEWNIHVDPDAAKACLAAWSVALAADASVQPPIGMGLDVTEQARLTPEAVAGLAKLADASAADANDLVGDPASAMRPTGSVGANGLVRFVVDALRFYFEFHATYDGFYGAFIHDPFVVAATIEPGLIETRPVFVDVETGPGLAHAMTIADWRDITGRPPNVDVAVACDAAAFLDRLVERVGGLAARGTPSDLRAPG
ncbi:MAG: nucleoside hydrolase [Chloroflexota bacterium]|nr:MAG: nucleoside hydrolase [Chloroflexota bacterium]